MSTDSGAGHLVQSPASMELGGPAPIRPWGDAVATALAVVIVGGPALFTNNGFAYDFTNHLWLVWVQEHAISARLAPTYFVNASVVGVFYPYFVFYGGTLYAATGALGVLLGGRVVVAYVGVILLSVAVAYGGLVWLSRQLGIGSWMAHAPAVTYVASAYYVTNIYGRGAWPEFVATSTIPLLVASGLKLARAPRVEPVPAALFVLAAVFFAGSHNISLLLGSLALIAGIVVLRVATGSSVVTGGWRRLAGLAALFILAIAVDAWFLIPDILHASSTRISSQALFPWSASSGFNTPAMLFDPLRAVPRQSTSPALFVQAPDWFLFWVVATAAWLWSGMEVRLRRAGFALVVLMGVVLATIMIGPLWDSMPRTLREVQFPYRLNTYVALCSAGLVLIGALALEGVRKSRSRRALSGGLVVAMAVSIALCLWQLWVPDTANGPVAYTNRHSVFVSTNVAPRTWYDNGAYVDESEPVIARLSGSLVIDPTEIHSDHVALKVTPPAGGGALATNIGAGPYVVKIGGGLVGIGRSALGLRVVRRKDVGRPGPLVLSIGPAGGSLALGRDVTVLAAIALLLLFVSSCFATLSRSRAGVAQPLDVGEERG
ncbi:MAG: hypothetical protein ACLPZR_32335 [Solirubrobacteraceae bacterium]